MTKVHPNASSVEASLREDFSGICCGGGVPETAVLTVWRKSLLFNGNGFTVFDAKGNLVFRVDNYASGNKGEIVLMDAAGKPLLTIRRKGFDSNEERDVIKKLGDLFWILTRWCSRVQRLSLGDHWLIYDGEEAANPRFSMRKHVNLLHSKALAHVTPCHGGAKSCVGTRYEIEGSYSQRCCAVYDERQRQLAEIRRKEAVGGVVFGVDVFRLIVEPGFDASVAMAIVILLEQMFGSRGSLLRG
ncbi:protein LURP-one-related 8-like isoform X1 [Elaeis guineensis]|uniref:Protein LURP-one-related 8 isoform X1 n=1 Tax=Elaeis guineensis var. tenera TaxID=51953 RepID=A0A6I9R6J1_ELAGV|nr:protein LURP-one-related 8 isoform X1 [Elaeis guineensis]